MAAQAGLSLTWSKILKTGFLVTRLIMFQQTNQLLTKTLSSIVKFACEQLTEITKTEQMRVVFVQ